MTKASENDPLVLAPEWVEWLALNFAEGIEEADLLGPLTEAGVPMSVARGALGEIRKNEVMRAFRRASVERDQLREVCRLKRELSRLGSNEPVARKSGLSREEFFGEYYRRNRPVILTDVCRDWPAISLWSRAEYFAEKFGETVIDVCMGRDSETYPDRNFKNLVQQMKMSEYVAWVLTAGTTNDGYLISNNRLLENVAFEGLLSDITFPDAYVDRERRKSHMSFWFGPAGTVTPLHHDGNNILFCQVVGDKEFFLVSPFETELIKRASGYYAHAGVPFGMMEEGGRPADEAFAWPATRLVLKPGEALFLPVGWWHQVRALKLSVSLSFLNFHEDNRFKWYGPGKLNRRAGS